MTNLYAAVISPSNILQSMTPNPWIRASLLATGYFVLVGAAWSWLLPDMADARHPRWMRYIVKWAQNALLSVLISTLTFWLFAEIGHLPVTSRAIATAASRLVR